MTLFSRTGQSSIGVTHLALDPEYTQTDLHQQVPNETFKWHFV